MTPRRRLGTLLAVALLLLVFSYLFYGTQAVDLDAQNRVGLTLREMEKLDAEWNVNILRSHIGLNPDYDPLTAPLPRLHELEARLGAALQLTRGPAAARAFDSLVKALRAKEELVEQFKSQNAILRNSLIYFPPAITDLKTELSGINGAGVPGQSVLELDATLNLLLTDVLRFNLAPDADLGAVIEHNVATIVEARRAFPSAIADMLDELARHARAILRYRQLENTLEAQIDSTATTAAMDQLGVLFDRAFDQVLIEKQRLRGYLFAYSGVLLALMLYLGWRLRRSYRIIGVVNRHLQSANATLEQRVAERTAELQEQSARLEQLARHDGLTGLINYGQLTRQLEHALLRASRRNTTVAVMFIDLDGFKAVNDTYGHATGDQVLKAVARRVQARLRQEDALARLGGDEFVILLEEVASREGATRVAQIALEEIRGIHEADGQPVQISASIGISSAHGRIGAVRGAATLLAEADQAMYQAKQAGKNGYAFSAQAQWGSVPVLAR
ncbi:MAG: DAHL domain-containing protein [Pseudomonadota bacterium]